MIEVTGSQYNRSAGNLISWPILAGCTLIISAFQKYRLLPSRRNRLWECGKMITVHDPVKTLQKELETWGTPFVELDCFGTDNAEQIAEVMNEFCRVHLGSSQGDR